MAEPALRVALADDEPIARRGLERLLRAEPGVEVAAVCDNGSQAIEAIRATRPDVALLDIAMPMVSGIDVVRQLSAGERPAVVFITAFDQYAIEAFELYAVDYLLKPFDKDRLHLAIDRARARVRGDKAATTHEQLDALLTALDHRAPGAEQIAVKQGDRIVLVPIDALDWCEAADNYVRLHANGQRYLVRTTMQRMEERLDARRFARIHRGALVNLSCVRELRSLAHGEYEVRLTDGTTLMLSRRHRDAVLERLRRG